MKLRYASMTAIAMSMCFAAALPAAAQTTRTTETTVTTVKEGHHEYIYYGDHDIYYAPTTKTYYWRDGERWTSGAELPPGSRTYVTNGGVRIELDTERPYERDAWVVEHYKHHHDRDDNDH